MKLSIIIPILNEEDCLPRLLKSIRQQNFFDYEIILADAGSTDKTLKIASAYKVDKIIKGGLPAKGRNNGAKAAEGEIFLFVDADVFLPAGFLQKSISELDGRLLDIASCLIEPITSKRVDKFLYKSVDIYFKMTQGFFPHSIGSCIFARKWLHNKIDGFDETIKLAEDHDYARRGIKLANFGYLSTSIKNNTRRIEIDGRFKIGFKYTLCELHRIFLGEVRTNIFNYQFAHYKNYKKRKFFIK